MTGENAAERRLARERAIRLEAEKIAERTIRELYEANQRLVRLDRFAGIVAHDLRNPLTASRGLVELVAERAADRLDAEERQALDRVIAVNDRLESFVEDLLAFTRSSAAQVELIEVDLGLLVKDILEAHPGDLEADVGPLPTLPGDPMLLRQALSNVIDNAIRYTRPGALPLVRVRAALDEDVWEIAVTDRGLTIPARLRRAVFEPFRRLDESDQPGTGLGLAIVREAVDRLGGTVHITSAPGGGNTFWLRLRTTHLSA